MNKKIFIGAVLVVFIVLSAFFVWANKVRNNPSKTDATNSNQDQGGQSVSDAIEQDKKSNNFDSSVGDSVSSLSSDWKIYRSNRYKFQIEFPSDWNVDNKNANSVSIVSPGTIKKSHEIQDYPESNLTVSVYKSISDLADLSNQEGGPKSLESYLTEIKSYNYISDFEKTEINGLPAYETTWIEGGSDKPAYQIYLENKGMIYELLFPSSRSRGELGGNEEKLLNSFKLLNIRN